MNQKKIIVGILTISDRASKGVYEDLSGPAATDWLKKAIKSEFEIEYKCIPDEKEVISAEIIKHVDELGCSLLLTLGGTGPAPRDVTPEATLAVCEKELPGFGEQMRAISLKYVPTAILSRQVGAIRGKCLVVNLPGQPKAIGETLGELFQAIPYCIELMEGPVIRTQEAVVKAFRPKSAPKIED
ncbi:MAG: molybdopterin adenylyltransferase [SAR324 cluster bacterium]|nr:molybdopterin adenylyltransferase [SAR324 cluster bacterium]